MRILFTSEEVVDICNGRYYSMNLGQHLTKYSYLGDITCLCYCRNVESTTLPEVDRDAAKFVFTTKENSLKAKLTQKGKNIDIINQSFNNVDILIAHLPSNNSYHAISIAKHNAVPYMVVVVGCIWDSMWNYDWRGKLLALPEYLKQRMLVLNAPYALYVTEHFLQKRYPCAGKIEYASNVCIEDVSEEILKYRLSRIISYPKDATYNIVTVASVSVRYKGQEYVIRAIAKLNNMSGGRYHYYMIGGGDPSFLRSLAEKYGVIDYVHFLGALNHEKVIEALDNMDMYIQPSKQEGLPRALIEAMSRALPAIGTKVAGIPELLNDEFLVDKGSDDAIVNMILTRMSKDSMLRQAENNFRKSSEYRLATINSRRQRFFDAFVEQYFNR